jgi:hypothetical protein
MWFWYGCDWHLAALFDGFRPGQGPLSPLLQSQNVFTRLSMPSTVKAKHAQRSGGGGGRASQPKVRPPPLGPQRAQLTRPTDALN